MRFTLFLVAIMGSLTIISTAYASTVDILEGAKDQKGNLIIVIETQEGPKGFYGDKNTLYELHSSLQGNMGPDHNQLEVFDPRLDSPEGSRNKGDFNSFVDFGWSDSSMESTENTLRCKDQKIDLTRLSDGDLHQLADMISNGKTKIVGLPDDTSGRLYELVVRTGVDTSKHVFLYYQYRLYKRGDAKVYLGEASKMVAYDLKTTKEYQQVLPDGSYVIFAKQGAAVVSPDRTQTKYTSVDLSNFDVKWLGIPGVPGIPSKLRTPCEKYIK